MKKRWFSLALAGVLAVSATLAGCGGFSDSKKEAGKDGKEAKEFRVAISSDIPDLDPALCSDNQSGFVANQIYQSLTRIGVDGKALPEAAEKVEHNEDYSVWTFTLRDGLKFSNGDPLTAEDVKWSWLRFADPATKSGQANRITDYVKGAEAFFNGEATADEVGLEVKDEKTFVVTLSKPTPYFDEICAYPTYSILNKKVVESDKEWFNKPETMIGSGPYKMEAYNLGKDIIFVKNENYFEADKVQVERAHVDIIKDENTVYEKFKAKELDFVGTPVHSLPSDKLEEAKTLPGYDVLEKNNVYWFKVNTKNGPVANKHLRRALAMAIDRQSIVDNILAGDVVVATGMVPEFKSKLFKDNDVDGAKAELEIAMKELGITDPSTITVALSYNTNEAHQKIAQAVQENWKKTLGINAELDNSEWKVYLEKVKSGDYQIGRLGWVADFTDPADFLNMYMFEEGDDNMTYWHSEAYNAKIAEANQDYENRDARNNLLKEAEAMIVEDMPVIPVYFGTSKVLKQPDTVEKLEVSVQDNLYIRDVVLK